MIRIYSSSGRAGDKGLIPLGIAAAWPGAHFMKTSGLGHRRILRDAQTVAAAVDFIVGR
jgi:hypothetical protein